MKIFSYPVYAVFSLMLFTGIASATITKLSPSDRAALEQGGAHPKMVYSAKDIPKSIISGCAADTSDHECELADPGEEFRATDLDTNKNLPRRRLVWGAHIPGYYILQYEAGGRGRSYHIMVITYDDVMNSGAKVSWRGISDQALQDYDAFLAALAADKLDDTLGYSF